MELKQVAQFLSVTGLSLLGPQNPGGSNYPTNHHTDVSTTNANIEKINVNMPPFGSLHSRLSQPDSSLNTPLSDQSLLKSLHLNQNEKKIKSRVSPLGSIPVSQPTYVSLGSPLNSDNNREPKRPLYITGSGLFKSHVSEVSDIKSVIEAVTENREIDPPKVLTTQLKWPNQVSEIPKEIFGRDNLLLVTDGFLMPGKTTGNVYVLDKLNGEVTPLLANKKGWYYHEAKFKDMNGDGIPDLLTARSNAFMLFKGDGELVWAEGKKDFTSKPLSELGPMLEHVIGKGPDFFFSVHDIDNDGVDEIIAPEFSNEKLSVFKQTGLAEEEWQRVELASGIGPLFDVKILKDKDDQTILITNHVDDLRAGLYALERNPSKPALSEEGWVQKVIFKNIETRKKGPGQASPGSIAPFSIHTTGAPINASPSHLFLSGDGSGSAYIIEPDRNAKLSDISKITPLVDESECMLGMPLAERITQDGSIQLLVPVFEKNRIDLFNYNPHEK